MLEARCFLKRWSFASAAADSAASYSRPRSAASRASRASAANHSSAPTRVLRFVPSQGVDRKLTLALCDAAAAATGGHTVVALESRCAAVGDAAFSAAAGRRSARRAVRA